MSTVTYSKFDASKYLTDEEAIREYFRIALEEGDSKTIQLVLRDIAKAQGMSSLADKTGLNRESLYKSLSATGNPSFSSILKIMDALDLQITLKAT